MQVGRFYPLRYMNGRLTPPFTFHSGINFSMDQWGFYRRDELKDPDGENAKIKAERDAMPEDKIQEEFREGYWH
jgi:hypothetical protein